eukprot:199739-Pleurochrysis_carterae.AAC.1
MLRLTLLAAVQRQRPELRQRGGDSTLATGVENNGQSSGDLGGSVGGGHASGGSQPSVFVQPSVSEWRAALRHTRRAVLSSLQLRPPAEDEAAAHAGAAPDAHAEGDDSDAVHDEDGGEPALPSGSKAVKEGISNNRARAPPQSGVRASVDACAGRRRGLERLRQLPGGEEVAASVILPLARPEAFAALGVRPPKGVLLHGPPGCAQERTRRFFKCALRPRVCPPRSVAFMWSTFFEMAIAKRVCSIRVPCPIIHSLDSEASVRTRTIGASLS